MPTNRDFRYTVCGIAYLLFTAFFVFFYDGTPASQVVPELKKWDGVSILGIVFSAPVIGILIGVITYGTLFCLYGYRIVYYVPTDETLINAIVKKHVKENDGSAEKMKLPVGKDGHFDTTKWMKKRKLHRELMPYYQLEVRSLIKEGSAEYLERRWAVIWTHINMIGGILAAFATASVYAACNDKHYVWAHPKYYTVSGLLGLTAYFYFAVSNTINTYKIGRDVEHCMLKARLNEKPERQKLVVRVK